MLKKASWLRHYVDGASSQRVLLPGFLGAQLSATTPLTSSSATGVSRPADQHLAVQEHLLSTREERMMSGTRRRTRLQRKDAHLSFSWCSCGCQRTQTICPNTLQIESTHRCGMCAAAPHNSSEDGRIRRSRAKIIHLASDRVPHPNLIELRDTCLENNYPSSAADLRGTYSV